MLEQTQMTWWKLVNVGTQTGPEPQPYSVDSIATRDEGEDSDATRDGEDSDATSDGEDSDATRDADTPRDGEDSDTTRDEGEHSDDGLP